MNVLALIAGLLVLMATGVHAVVGAREFSFIKPTDTDKPLTVWVQTLSGWHWVSLDQFLAAGVLLVIGFSDVIDAEPLVLLLVSIYFGLCGLVWLVTVLVAGRQVERSLLTLGQWIYCFVIAGLVFLAR